MTFTKTLNIIDLEAIYIYIRYNRVYVLCYAIYDINTVRYATHNLNMVDLTDLAIMLEVKIKMHFQQIFYEN